MGKWQSQHALECFVRKSFAADVPILARRVGAHHQKVATCLDLAVTRSGRQHSDVTSPYFQIVPVLASQHQARMSTGETEHLVCRRMVMMEVVYSITPLRRPAILCEKRLEGRGRIRVPGNTHRSVKQNRQTFVIWNPTVAFEPQDFGLSTTCWLRANAGRCCYARARYAYSSGTQQSIEASPFHIVIAT